MQRQGTYPLASLSPINLPGYGRPVLEEETPSEGSFTRTTVLEEETPNEGSLPGRPVLEEETPNEGSLPGRPVLKRILPTKEVYQHSLLSNHSRSQGLSQVKF